MLSIFFVNATRHLLQITVAKDQFLNQVIDVKDNLLNQTGNMTAEFMQSVSLRFWGTTTYDPQSILSIPNTIKEAREVNGNVSALRSQIGVGSMMQNSRSDSV